MHSDTLKPHLYFSNLSEEEEQELIGRVKDFLYELFSVSLSGDYEKMESMHWRGEDFTKIGATDGYGITLFEEGMKIDRHSFSRITNGKFFIEDLHITIVDRVIICAFLLRVSGITSPLGQEVQNRRRSTVVLVNVEDKLYILHKHYSGFPMF